MDFDDQFELAHLFLTERKCRICGNVKDLIDGFYLSRKDRGTIPSSYSYECKTCTIQRIIKSRKKLNAGIDWQYPDW